MRKTFIAAAAATVIALAYAAPANAWIGLNGGGPNGSFNNGSAENGGGVNGGGSNGGGSNGGGANGGGNNGGGNNGLQAGSSTLSIEAFELPSRK